MNLKKTLAFFFLLLTYSVNAQKVVTVKGTVNDTLNKKQLQNAVVSIVKAKDSMLVAFVRTKADGSFEINNISNDKYFITITSPSYADYSDTLILDENTSNLGKIILTNRSRLLEAVVVQQKIAAIRFKGDTLEFKADSFKVGANANVQELLRKLPGISINNKGEITAQGQDVKKVLVDGEEFFSDDPAVVTKGLRADAIDKVQVFDKKSDQATFTGIDDGVKDKTINLQMKEDKKKGHFGKLEAGTDFGDYRYGKGMLNVFKGKQKFAVYATADNTNFESLNWNEKTNYGEDLNRTTEMNDDGGMSMWSSGDNFSEGQGFPSSNTGGLHYSRKWNEDKHNIINTYQYHQLGVYGSSISTNQTLLDSNSLNSKTIENFDSYRRRNRLKSSYEWKIDSTSDLKVSATGSIVNTLLSNDKIGSNSNFKGNLINNNITNSNSNATEKNLIGSLIWRKRMQKKGRTISLAFDGDLTDNKKNSNLLANNTFYKTGLTINEKIDQFKIDNEDKFNFKTKLAYTEPLWKNSFLEINTSVNRSSNDAVRTTLEKSGFGTDYTKFIDSLSTNFRFNNTGLFGGANFKYQGKKINFNFGTSVGNMNLTVKDNLRTDNRNVNFLNWQPNAGFNYSPKKQTRIGISYGGRNRNPSLLQIQPFIDNTTPLNVSVGNPNLKQEFTHSFNFNFSDYKIIKSKNMYVQASYSFTNNAISNASVVDTSTGKTTNQAINVNGNSNFNMWANYGFDLFESFNVNFQFSPNINRFVNVVNGKENINKSARYKFSISSGYWGDKWINYWLGFGPSFNSSSSSINSTKTEYWQWDGNYDINMKWKSKRISLNINGELNFFQKTNQFSNNANYAMLNAYLKKALDKDEKWELQFGVHDILNQNQGVNRNINSNFISENISRNVQRYGMLSITYNFSKNGKPSNGW